MTRQCNYCGAWYEAQKKHSRYCPKHVHPGYRNQGGRLKRLMGRYESHWCPVCKRMASDGRIEETLPPTATLFVCMECVAAKQQRERRAA